MIYLIVLLGIVVIALSIFEYNAINRIQELIEDNNNLEDVRKHLKNQLKERDKELSELHKKYSDLKEEYGLFQRKSINIAKNYEDDKNYLHDEVNNLKSLLKIREGTIKEYQRTQKNDRAKIKRDEKNHKFRLEAIKEIKKELVEATNTIHIAEDKIAVLEKEKHLLEIKLKMKAPRKKKKNNENN